MSAIVDYTFGNKKYSHRKRVLLSDVSVKITRRNSDNQIFNVLSNSANYGIIPQSEVFDHEIANKNNTSNYFVISKNDFVYNPRKSVTAPYGPINRYNGETAGVISPLYLCFRCYDLDVESDDGKNVFSVVVLFDPSGEWNNLVSTYDYYKDLYTRKYGDPAISKENNPSRSDSNTALMAEVHQGTVVYGSAWNVPGGDIQLSIEKSSGIYEGMVMIRYRDSQNVEAKIQSDLEDI